MELEFIPERMHIVCRLKGISMTQIDIKMREISGAKNSYNIDRWAREKGKRNFERVQLMSEAVELPVGFFYYKTVDIEMKNMRVFIHIPDTGERIDFDFIRV